MVFPVNTLQMFLLYIMQLISLEHAFSLAKYYFMVYINAFIPRMNDLFHRFIKYVLHNSNATYWEYEIPKLHKLLKENICSCN